MSNQQWTLTEAVELIKKLQPLAFEHGFNLALAGSVLIEGYSDNDLDIIVYVHKTEKLCNDQVFLTALKSQGFSDAEQRDHTDYGDEKLVFKNTNNGKIIDWFFSFINFLPRIKGGLVNNNKTKS